LFHRLQEKVGNVATMAGADQPNVAPFFSFLVRHIAIARNAGKILQE
jgi:hypothetical protein